MKLVQLLDARGTALVSDVKNQRIMKELVLSDYSVTELASELNIPTVTLWKRVQKLLAAGMIEVSETRKSGNLEKKLYRATAARYTPAELLELRPRDAHHSEAFEVYARIQKVGWEFLSQMNKIPEGVDPVDYGLYANMMAFVRVLGRPDIQVKISELEEKLSEYEPSVDLKSKPSSGMDVTKHASVPHPPV